MTDIKTNDSAAHAPEEVRKWADRLTKAQGCPTVLARETSGYHLYLPCPKCLETHGRRELDDPKYAINLSILAGLGEHREEAPARWRPGMFEEQEDRRRRREWGAGVCMRTRSSREPHIVSLESLLHAGTVSERHPDIHTRADLRGGHGSAENEDMWEEDPVSGKLAPPPPGETVPLTSLPPEHPAIVYLTGRGYDPAKLEEQFRSGFCVKQYPRGEKGIYYRRMPGGWLDSPQHRVTFCSLIGGVPLTWQARVIERVSDDELNRFMLHPMAGGFVPTLDHARARTSIDSFLRTAGASDEVSMTRDTDRGGYWVHLWSHTDTRSSPNSKWMPMPPYDEVGETGVLKFRPSKYRTAKYSSRQLMGWDAAVRRADESGEDLRWAVLSEGPLDAARPGPGGIATIGSSISPENADRLVSQFHVVILAYDADKAGMEAVEKIAPSLHSSSRRNSILVASPTMQLPPGRDLGDLTPESYEQLFRLTFKRIRRSL